MRRLALLVTLLMCAGIAVVAIVGTSAQGSSSGTFDVIFDNAQGLISGQLVKVAGAKAGEIQNVTLTKSGLNYFGQDVMPIPWYVPLTEQKHTE